MLPDPAQVAAAGATALATAAGTQLWETVRTTIARLFARRSVRAERNALNQLDAVHTQLTKAATEKRQEIETRWRDRLEDLLAELDDAELDLAARQITDLARRVEAETGATMNTGDHSMAAGRDLTITAEGGSIAGVGQINGNVHPPNPSVPGPDNA